MTGTAVIRGGGVVALMAAIAIKRAVSHWRVAIAPAATAADGQPGAADATIAAFHERVGLPAALFRRETGATPVTGALFSGWGTADFVVPEAARERFVDGIAVHHLWFRREAAGAPPLDRLLGEPDAPTAWRFDVAAYAQLLRRMARQIGVDEADATDGDLVVDCGPPVRRGDDWTDWSAYLPTLRTEQVAPGAATTGGTERLVRSGDRIDWASAIATVRLATSGGGAGRSRSPWRGRRVSIGPAAIDLPPLLGLPLSAALGDVLRLVRLLPDAADPCSLAAEYNRQSAIVHDALLDLASAPFAVGPGRRGETSPGVAAALAQFRRRGRVPLREGDPIGRGRWIALLAGLGIRPDRIDPVARVPDDHAADRLLSALALPS